MSTPESLPRAFGSHYLLVQLHASVTGQTFIALPTKNTEEAEWKVVKKYSQVLATPNFVSKLKQEAAQWEPIAGLAGVGAADYGKVGATTFRAAPFFPSKDAQKILTKCFHLKRKTPAAVALEIAAQSALILSEVKQNTGWLHTSLRPAHVLIGYNGKIRLLDFGTAKDILTTQVPPGSPLDLFYLSYCAPEVAEGGVATHQSDLFGVGIVLYELLTGSKLFPAQAPSRADLAKIVAQAKVNPPSKTTPGLPAAVDELVLRALSPAPLQRFLTGEEFANKARSLAASLGAHGEQVVSSFIKEIFAAEIAQEEQFFQRSREAFKSSPPPADPSEEEHFGAPPMFAPNPEVIEPPKPVAIANETDFLPVPEEEKAEEPKQSTNPLFSLDSLRGPAPKPSISGPQEGSGVLPVLARLTEPRHPTPIIPVPLPKPQPLAVVEATPEPPPLEPPPLEPPPLPIPPKLEEPPSQLAATLFQPEPPKKPASSQLEATLLEDAPSSIPVPPPPAIVEAPKPPKREEEPPRRAEPRKQPAEPVLIADPPSKGNSVWWVSIIFSVIFAASAGGYLLWRSTQEQTETPNIENKPKPIPNVEYKYTLRTDPSGAKVFVNGKEQGPSPLELFFPANEPAFEYTIKVTLEGYKEQTFALKPTSNGEKTLTLESLAPAQTEPASTQAASTQAASEPASQPKELTPAEKRAAEKAAREEEKRKAAEEKKRLADEKKKAAEEKKRLADEEKKRKAEEAKQKREEERKKKETEKKTTKDPKPEDPKPEPKPDPKPEEPKPEPSSQP